MSAGAHLALVVAAELLLSACGSRTVGGSGEGEGGGEAEGGSDAAEWWEGTYSRVEEAQGGLRYLSRYVLDPEGGLRFEFTNCNEEMRTKIGEWQVAGEGERVDLLSEDGLGPFTPEANEDVGAFPMWMRRELDVSGDCEVRLGADDGAGGSGTLMTRGAQCLASGNECLSSDDALAVRWCDGAPPELPACPAGS